MCKLYIVYCYISLFSYNYNLTNSHNRFTKQQKQYALICNILLFFIFKSDLVWKSNKCIICRVKSKRISRSI